MQMERKQRYRMPNGEGNDSGLFRTVNSWFLAATADFFQSYNCNGNFNVRESSLW